MWSSVRPVFAALAGPPGEKVGLVGADVQEWIHQYEEVSSSNPSTAASGSQR